MAEEELLEDGKMTTGTFLVGGKILDVIGLVLGALCGGKTGADILYPNELMQEVLTTEITTKEVDEH